ncbi:NADH dehydrogenase subunit G [Rhodothalassium salexigens DSM 2132]|uniref:NADH-quinone oxidoreductase n=1 Tax=Rhodothalassium salexigens DSM 2132 TaxID=1188247 RepID=A0A4R2PR84_RHOSA|nr:NADH-quinone oxidoreductase subunit NuoG [Rhodothalassium salexigens]MBB4210198.1 NADH-quinone oxidoreductase subunit G [Rhodothalassium salexigens DSM 2132]MBK1638538.1 NADH-quinone oxidoreductase subunit G [Rhodothalassium salexigens DSM 2132]TCP38362.1 NADH dehydrogenase subunit G [Rhodothalassium salexigens DSM 2132]
MPKLTVNDIEVEVEPGTTVLQACEEAGFEIPRFCYHERLSIAGNCRMCLVEMENSPKPIASCAITAADGMTIRTNTEMVKKAREGVLEFLLINHPLDCPICDQGGECDLQDETMAYGLGTNRFAENKRAVTEKHMGPLIKTIMTRCIHCTRCIRFAEEVAGVTELGAIYRGEDTQITTYLEHAMKSELQGNVIDLCPVGALTSKPYAFTARSWELTKTPSVDVMDAVGSSIRVDSRGTEVMRILPRLNEAVNEEWISDKTRFAYDGLKYRRLDRPYVNKNGALTAVTWAEAFTAIAERLKGLKGSDIAAIMGDLNDVEGMAACRDLLAALGSDKVEGRPDGTKLESGVRAGYLFNTGIEGIEQADLCLLVGTDPRHEASIINARLLKATRHSGLKVAHIGPEADLTYPVEELGDDAAILTQIRQGKHPFSKRLEAAERPMIIVGQGALVRDDGAEILKRARDLAEKYGLVRDDWNGFNVLHTAAARVGALDLGLTTPEGAAGLLDAAESGGVKALFLMGTDEVDLSRAAKAFTVYIGSHGDAGLKAADVILPAAAYTEKNGLYVNTEGRVVEGFRAVSPPGEAREDWKILRALSEVMGHKLPYDNQTQLRQAIYERCPHMAVLEEKPTAEWGEFGAQGTVEAGPIAPVVTDFYRTNPIARASKTMAECSALKYGAADEQGATGTDG